MASARAGQEGDGTLIAAALRLSRFDMITRGRPGEGARSEGQVFALIAAIPSERLAASALAEGHRRGSVARMEAASI
jgi:hypothetical protein